LGYCASPGLVRIEVARESRAGPERSRTCKNWSDGSPGLVLSGPGPVKSGVPGVPGQSWASPGQVKIGVPGVPGWSRAVPSRPVKSGVPGVPGQSRAVPDRAVVCSILVRVGRGEGSVDSELLWEPARDFWLSKATASGDPVRARLSPAPKPLVSLFECISI